MKKILLIVESISLLFCIIQPLWISAIVGFNLLLFLLLIIKWNITNKEESLSQSLDRIEREAIQQVRNQNVVTHRSIIFNSRALENFDPEFNIKRSTNIFKDVKKKEEKPISKKRVVTILEDPKEG